ncbi:phage shock protein A (IM30), suppresses sigma54-dependent transcription [Rubidibacter lacunae KORDI 51-2]|uniref:Phage shock protein A (IM30), suppresses sigma54-dependent transcription n=1 Tax=Rubidibacter lacunae KORDI 51-2 TaxID=582515 RepID=U5DQ79_9CHRO|nr:lecithin retinol acyltransferase family protein [Rubidibacter lacunae]ERN41850.1 phage shock protein A (IM30), suppresses sigma54-dependent transcription [Rubidibacter lacunae KORDI 51-2]
MARGDQIFTLQPLAAIQGLYEHHGIDCGDGTVVHLRKGNATIEQTSLAEFALGRPVSRRLYSTCYLPDTVIDRARSRLGERADYNLLFNNCEHFATWCKTGVHHSQQVEDFLPFLSRAQLETLSEPLRVALETGPAGETEQLVDRALDDLKAVWNEVQPRYRHAIAEARSWNRVARAALHRKREDLARAALHRKRAFERQAALDKDTLDRLARVTEMVLRARTVPARGAH